jgi:hypothetical protein
MPAHEWEIVTLKKRGRGLPARTFKEVTSRPVMSPGCAL